MLAIEVELLAGRYAATQHNDRSRAEWPPHPARFFSALVAALHDRDPVDAAEREALLWLEQQGVPLVDVDLNVNETTGRREVRSVFVPVNDVAIWGDPERKLRDLRSKLARLEGQEQTSEVVAKMKKASEVVEKESQNLQGIGLLPERRNRQERTFPVIIPERTSFAFMWLEAEPADHVNALRRLCDRVTRLGHSSSLVRCAIIERSIKPTLVPQERGEHVLRIVGPGQLERLERAYVRHQAIEARVLPARPQRYGEPVDKGFELPRSVFTEDLDRLRTGRRPPTARLSWE